MESSANVYIRAHESNAECVLNGSPWVLGWYTKNYRLPSSAQHSSSSPYILLCRDRNAQPNASSRIASKVVPRVYTQKSQYIRRCSLVLIYVAVQRNFVPSCSIYIWTYKSCGGQCARSVRSVSILYVFSQSSVLNLERGTGATRKRDDNIRICI